MKTSVSLIADSWNFYRKQPVLNVVLLVLLIIPSSIMAIFTRMAEEYGGIATYGGFLPVTGPMPLVIDIAFLGLILVTFWGMACVLLVGKRMIHSPAGRARTSFRAVRSEALPLVFPLFFTAILRGCIIFLLSLLYIVPVLLYLLRYPDHFPFLPGPGSYDWDGPPWAGVPVLLLLPLLIPAAIYGIRTTFYGVVLVAEGLSFREALQRSAQVVRGQTWKTLGVLVAICLLLFVPAALLMLMIESTIGIVDVRFLPVSDILQSGITNVAGLLFTLCMVGLYGELRGRKGKQVEL